MILASLLLLLAAQQSGQPLKEADPKPAPWPDDVQFAEKGERHNTPFERATLQQFGACIADTSTARASRALAGDFRTPAYRRAIDQLVEANRGCPAFRGWTRMRASRLLLAGAIAERLIERDPAPINNRLAKAAALPAAQAYSPSDAGAICVVRSMPDGAGRLFDTEPGSAPEAAAAAPLKALLARCMGGRAVEVTDTGLRAILATATFRSVHSEASN